MGKNKNKNKNNNATNNSINSSSNNQKINPTSNDEKINNIIADLNTLLNYGKVVEGKLNILTDTLIRLQLVSVPEIKKTEELYAIKDQLKENKIKEIMNKEITTKELLILAQDNPNDPNYLKFNLDPVADLNANPYELAHILTKEFPDKKFEEILEMAERVYKLKKFHFGIGEPE